MFREPTPQEWKEIYDKVFYAVLELEVIGGDENQEVDGGTPDKVLGVRSLLLDAMDRITEED